MGMPTQDTDWTAERAIALPDDGKRYVALDGELFVSPAPRPDHQSVVLQLIAVLNQYVRTHKLGWVFASPTDIEFSPRRYVQPDVFVVSDIGQGRPRSWAEARPISLIAEVVSESTARADRFTKRRTYQSEGIPLYWIVDSDARLVECWTPGDERPDIANDSLNWQPRDDIPALVISLPEFFADALE